MQKNEHSKRVSVVIDKSIIILGSNPFLSSDYNGT